MGKTNKGKELGNAIYQRANGTYEARYIDRFGKQRSVYGKTITEVGRKQREKTFENEKQINVIDTKMTLMNGMISGSLYVRNIVVPLPKELMRYNIIG